MRWWRRHTSANRVGYEKAGAAALAGSPVGCIASGSSVPGEEWFDDVTKRAGVAHKHTDRAFINSVESGGGHISFAFAHIVERAGVRATILHRGERPLDRFDPDLVDRLVGRTRELSVDIRLRAEVRSIIGGSDGFNVRALAEGGEREFEADLVVHGASRVPEIDDMQLAEAGIEWDPCAAVPPASGSDLFLDRPAVANRGFRGSLRFAAG